jgi:hypothetical protein
MDRAQALDRVEAALSGRKLVWLGKRGEDARPLLSLEGFSASFSIIAPLRSTQVESVSIEGLTGIRDEFYSLDGALQGPGEAFAQRLESTCTDSALLFAYRPYGFLLTRPGSAAAAKFLGISRELYRALDRKPNVEQGLRRDAGIETLPWSYVAPGPERLSSLQAAFGQGPIVLRRAVGSGGDGFELINVPDQLAGSELAQEDDEIAWSPFVRDYVPVNLGGCVFDDGGVTLHTPSVQLVGLPLCTQLPFAYCGNDYAAAGLLAPAALDSLERMSLAAGRWLWSKDYRGAFGLDAMVRNEDVLFTEINPRFQGSSRPSGYLDEQAGLPDIFLDHLAALLGLPSYLSPPLRELAREQRLAHVYCYNYLGGESLVPPALAVPDGVTAYLEPAAGVHVGFRSALFELEFARQITSDGLSIDEDAAAAVEGALGQARPITELAPVEAGGRDA